MLKINFPIGNGANKHTYYFPFLFPTCCLGDAKYGSKELCSFLKLSKIVDISGRKLMAFYICTKFKILILNPSFLKGCDWWNFKMFSTKSHFKFHYLICAQIHVCIIPKNY
jgi:hypothetical protein